ncbi:flavin reductase family protein [Amycolatopsis sp. cmx-4-68]|uniref:flavin reductase family protein n=1 Tax=Amycolatopsis sp. cmx-4-68 TaxID=2790938 RepID=UPI00397AAA77
MGVPTGETLVHRPDEVVPARLFRHVAGHYPTGVAVMCCVAGGEPLAMTVNSFVTVSLEPPLVLVSLLSGGRMAAVLRTGSAFALSVLAEHQAGASQWFARSGRARGRTALDGFDWQSAAVTGSPVLAGSAAYFDCTVESRIPAGDHTLVLGDVRSVGEPGTGTRPLVFCRGKYGSVDLPGEE